MDAKKAEELKLVCVGNKYFKKVVPAGTIVIGKKKYFLLNPHPIEADWEFSITERRFVVVEARSIGTDKDYNLFYSYARHVVTNMPYRIEYGWHSDPILVWYLEELDLDNVEPKETEEIEPTPEELLKATEHPVRDVNDFIREKQEKEN